MIVEWLKGASEYPILVYSGIIIFSFLSSFGLPIPEEIVLVTSGSIAFMALQEAAKSGAEPTINPYTLAAVAFFAVFLSDLLIFYLGRTLGTGLSKKGPFKKLMNPTIEERVYRWTEDYGALACGIFRFTPGLRFFGHLTCGALKISYTKFILVDGIAALISVPTQVLLLAFYGDEILEKIQQFKIYLVGFGVAIIIGWVLYKRSQRSKQS